MANGSIVPECLSSMEKRTMQILLIPILHKGNRESLNIITYVWGQSDLFI